MKAEEVLKIIQEHSLTVRCLPHKVESYLTYHEGDETRKWSDSGNTVTREVITQFLDLEYFRKKKPAGWDKRTPEERYQDFKKVFPRGRKLLKETRIIAKGGWWYVKPTKHTSATVTFGSKYDEFLAPTIEEAIGLYLDSLPSVS